MAYGIRVPNPHEQENPYEALEEQLPACFICGGCFRYPLSHGMAKCDGCGANYVVEHTDAPPAPDHSDLPAITREDADHLLDLIAAEKSTGYADRSQGR